MKIGFLGISGITQVVVNRKVAWKRMGKGRWVLHRLIEGEAPLNMMRGMSDLEMHNYLNEWHTLAYNDIWMHGDTINVVRKNDKPGKEAV